MAVSLQPEWWPHCGVLSFRGTQRSNPALSAGPCSSSLTNCSQALRNWPGKVEDTLGALGTALCACHTESSALVVWALLSFHVWGQ